MDTLQSILNAMMREAVAPQTAAVAIAVIGLNIHFGFTGLLNFGQAGFMLLGAYGFAITIGQGGPLPLAILVGFAAALVFALVLGVPTLKLRGDYLAIVTISAAEIIRYIGRSALPALNQYTGGSQGIQGQTYQGPFLDLSFFGSGESTLLPLNYRDVADGATWVRLLSWLVIVALIVGLVLTIRAGKKGGFTTPVRLATVGLSVLTVLAALFAFPLNYFNTGVNGWWVRVVAWALVGLSTLVVLLLARSPWGRVLRGVREDEDAIRSLGKNVFSIKMQALVIGGLFGALGGMLYVLPSTVQPDSMGRNLTFFAYTALLLGGAATIFGPVLGSVLFFVFRIFIIGVTDSYIPNAVMNTQETRQFAFIAIGVALMLLVIFRPQGILGNKRELRFNV